MTDQLNLDEIRARAEAATPGPWGVGNRTTVASEMEQLGPGHTRYRYWIADLDDFNRDESDYPNPVEPAADAAFIAHARQDIPALLAEVARLRAELRDAGNDLLDVRGILSPNGYPRRVPMELVPTVAPAVKWLADEADRLRADIDDRDSEMSTLRQDLDLQTKAAWDNNAKVAELTAELAETRTQRDAAKAIADELRDDLRAADASNTNLQLHIAAIRAEATA